MANSYSGTWKNCATCTYWMGNRETDRFGQRVILPTVSEKGKCGIPRGPWRGQTKICSTQCSSWQKWPVLK